MAKIITSFDRLMSLAFKLGQAKKRGNKKEIALAQKEHDEYKKTCLSSDEITLGLKHGDL